MAANEHDLAMTESSAGFLPDLIRLGCQELVRLGVLATCLTSPRLLPDKPASKQASVLTHHDAVMAQVAALYWDVLTSSSSSCRAFGRLVSSTYAH